MKGKINKKSVKKPLAKKCQVSLAVSTFSRATRRGLSSGGRGLSIYGKKEKRSRLSAGCLNGTKKSGSGILKKITQLAKKIRRVGEKWPSALKHRSINQSFLPSSLQMELKGMEPKLNNEKLAELYKENFDIIYQIIEDQYPQALKKELASPSNTPKNTPINSRKTAKTRASTSQVAPYVAPKSKITSKNAGANPSVHTQELEHLPEDVRILKRCVGFCNKVKTKKQILNLYRDFNRRIIERRLNLKSDYKDLIEQAFEKFTTLINKISSEGQMSKVLATVDEAFVNAMKEVIKENKLRYSVNLLKRFVILEGGQPEKSKALIVLNSIKKAIDTGMISSFDRYWKEINKAKGFISAYINGQSDSILLEPVELSGLYGSINGLNGLSCSCKGMGCNSECSCKIPLAGSVVSAADLDKITFDVLEFDGRFKELIGNPSNGFYAIVWGLPKNGKSHLAFQFAKYLTKFGNILYVLAEEGISFTSQEKMREYNMKDYPVHFVDIKSLTELKEITRKNNYSAVFIDSINKFNISPEQFEEFRREHKNLSTIIVMQGTKSGNFKGSQEWTHNADSITHVENGIATQNGRFGTGEIEVFEN